MGVQQNQTILGRISQNSDMLFAAGVVSIILVMLVPLPALILDVLLTFNIAFALIVLIITLYALRPLDFSIFPSLLLVSTLFRLSLNVSSTRRILLYGHQGEGAAGSVIKSFGQFVVGGNYVVGFIIFLILVVIQFVVITKGSGRIAEVAARFTLDAMPGKQMSIDADLNAGLISESEARERRQMIAREADFHGAMDGASKFVRGDAIAGIIILVIDIIGGLIIGMIYHGMSVGDAGRVYSILTIGDGLVGQLPALLISTASGIIVSRAASESSFGKELSFQFLTQPKAFAIASGMLLIMGLIPGLPTVPFLLLSGISGVIAYFNRYGPVIGLEEIPEESGEAGEAAEEPEEDLGQLMEIDPMELEISLTLISLVNPEEGGMLLDKIKHTRRQCALGLGFVVPPIRIRDNIQLQPGEYDMLIRGAQAARGKLVLGRYLAMNSGAAARELGGSAMATQEPVFGLPAYWIEEAQIGEAELTGYVVVDPETVMVTHISETIKSYAHELFSRQELKSILDNIKQTYPGLVDELVPAILPIGTVHKVCQNLLREQVSIRDMVRILETLANIGTDLKDADTLTEYVRDALARTIIKPLVGESQMLKIITLEPSVEEIMTDALTGGMDGATAAGSATLALDSEIAHFIVNAAATAINNAVIDTQPIILCSSLVRRHLKRLIEPVLPNVVVLSYNEIPADVEVQQVGMVTLQLADVGSQSGVG